ncbi:MAG: DinB family protein [Haliscomenobacter sp.]|nr:DinB family protein [Haliscomenobacter sp.]
MKAMDKISIIQSLIQQHRTFASEITQLDRPAFMYAPEGKWTAGQQLDHILRSTRPLRLAFHLPKAILKLVFGKANRPSRGYDAVVEKYLFKLKAGGVATGVFIPKPVGFSLKDRLALRLSRTIASLCKGLGRFSEKELDEYVLPHPLLGKLTIREMLYFTLYHVEHHRQITRRNLESKQV